jgi:hypothetical protein
MIFFSSVSSGSRTSGPGDVQNENDDGWEYYDDSTTLSDFWYNILFYQLRFLYAVIVNKTVKTLSNSNA